MTKEVKIACEGHTTVPLDKLIVIQGGLKTLSDINAGKLQKSILKHGFSAPIFVWPHKTKVKTTLKVIDGTQRTAVLHAMRKDGYEVPEIPVAYVHAKTEKEAKEKILHITSQYGEFSITTLRDFLDENAIDIQELGAVTLVKGEMSLSVPSFLPVDESEQGKLDEIKKKQVTCPECGHEFEA